MVLNSKGKPARSKTESTGRCKRGQAYPIFLGMLSIKTSDCVEWPYGRGGQMGYGRVWFESSYHYVHQLSWKRSRRRQIPKGKFVLHHCDNPKCFNPRHVYLGTRANNTKDAISRNRTAKGEGNAASKLTRDDVVAIFNSALSARILAERYSVSFYTVQRIKGGKTWKHLKLRP